MPRHCEVTAASQSYNPTFYIPAGFPTYSHCSYTARPAGQPCQPGTSQGQQAAGAPASRGKGGVSSSEGQDGGASRGAHQCGGGVMRGLCLPANSYSREHERCQEFTCEHGLCHPPVGAV